MDLATDIGAHSTLKRINSIAKGKKPLKVKSGAAKMGWAGVCAVNPRWPRAIGSEHGKRRDP